MGRADEGISNRLPHIRNRGVGPLGDTKDPSAFQERVLPLWKHPELGGSRQGHPKADRYRPEGPKTVRYRLDLGFPTQRRMQASSVHATHAAWSQHSSVQRAWRRQACSSALCALRTHHHPQTDTTVLGTCISVYCAVCGMRQPHPSRM